MKKATNEMLRIVKSITKKYEGGERFFDLLDEAINQSSNRWLISAGLNTIPKTHTLVLSGGFGRNVASLIDDGTIPNRPYILFNGGVRSNGGVRIARISSGITNKSTFFDDSIYGGKTFYDIKKWMETNELPAPEKCMVIYDGCPVDKPEVKSLFRYYNFFKPEPNFIF